MMEPAVSVAKAMCRTYLGAAGRIFRLRTIALGVSAAGRGHPVTAPVAVRHRKDSLLADQRGAVAFEMLIVYSFMMFSLLFPAADLAIFGFQYISAWEALRTFGQYVQYNPPSDLTAWTPSQTSVTVNGHVYTIANPKIICGDGKSDCSDATLIPKYYSYTTTVTLNPLVLKSVLCPGGNCTFSLSYSERFQ
jgi:hypothetical protein